MAPKLCSMHTGLPWDLNRQIAKENILMAIKQMKRSSTWLAIKEMQMKTTGYHFLPMRRVLKLDNIKCWRGCGATEMSYQILHSHSDNHVEVSYKVKHTFIIWTRNPTPICLPRKVKTYVHTKHKFTAVAFTIAKPETIPMSFSSGQWIK